MLRTQRISELLAGLDEDRRQTFLAAWLRRRSESEYRCFDITSVSSYCTLDEHVKYGYNRDGEDLPQINLALLLGQKSMLSVYYPELPGNISDFNSKLFTYQRELESGELVAEHEEFYKRYFMVRETPKRGRRITLGVEAVKEHQNKYCGYYAILTNDVKDPALALRIYRDKDVVKKCFDDLKNQLDMRRLRTHGRFSTDGRLLVQFIAVTLMSTLRNKMRELKLDEKFTVRQLSADLETVSEVSFSGRYGKLLAETTKAQREMMEGLGVPAETWLQK